MHVANDNEITFRIAIMTHTKIHNSKLPINPRWFALNMVKDASNLWSAEILLSTTQC